MSLQIFTYIPTVDDSLIPAWLAKMKECGMDCEIHPEFSFKSQAGFLPLKLRIHDSAHQDLNEVNFLTGFEFYSEDFDLQREKAARLPQLNFIGRLMGRKSPAKPFASTDLDRELERCQKRLIFSWGIQDLFELRMATVSSAVIAELTGGLSHYPDDDVWPDREGSAKKAVSEALQYENSLKNRDLLVHPFEGWGDAA